MFKYTVELSDPMGAQPLVAEIEATNEAKAICEALRTEYWCLEPYKTNGETWNRITICIGPPQELDDEEDDEEWEE